MLVPVEPVGLPVPQGPTPSQAQGNRRERGDATSWHNKEPKNIQLWTCRQPFIIINQPKKVSKLLVESILNENCYNGKALAIICWLKQWKTDVIIKLWLTRSELLVRAKEQESIRVFPEKEYLKSTPNHAKKLMIKNPWFDYNRNQRFLDLSQITHYWSAVRGFQYGHG